MGRQWRVRILACLGVAVVLVAGCSQKQEASTSLPTTSSAKPSSTLPPLGPADFPVPDEARTQDAAGAKEALRYYIDLINHLGSNTGQPLRDLSRDCDWCSELADRVAQDHAAGYSYRGGDMTLDQVQEPAVHDGIAEFTFSASQARMEVLGPDGLAVSGRGDTELHGLRGAAAMTWSPGDRAWIVTQLFFRQ